MHIHGHGLRSAAFVALLTSAPLARPAAATDWPQIWGPTVSGAVEAAGPPGAWQLRELWRRPIGSGYSAVTISGGRGYTGEADGTTDHAIAFDVKTGQTLWRVPLGETHKGHDGSRDGPIATPAVSGGRVFMAGPRGTLVAFDAASGKELWRKDVLAVPQTKAPFYGFGASPIVAGSRVVLQVGGAEKSGLAAFDAANGTLAWTALLSETTGNSSGYTMAAPLTLGGQGLMVVTAHDRVFAVKAEDGSVAWSHPLAQPEEPTRAPLVLGEDRVLVSRGNNSVLLTVAREGEAWKVTEAWTSPRLKGGHSPTVHDNNDSLFGFSGQYLLCVDAKTGEPRWREKTYSGSLIRVGRHLVVLGEASGVLRVAEAVPSGYHEVARTSAFNAGSQSIVAPSYADGRIFVRNVEEMVAYAVSGAANAGGNP